MLSRQFHKCRRVLAILAAAAVAALVWFWPQEPLWRSPTKDGILRGSSPFGSAIVTARTHPFVYGGQSDPVIYRWDAFTGEQLSQTKLELADGETLHKMAPSADGSLALMQIGSDGGDWFLHDGTTGKRQFGPFPRGSQFDYQPFGADNRWISTDPWNDRHDFRIFSVAAGNCVYDGENSALKGLVHLVAPDVSNLAVLQFSNPDDPPETPVTVSIVDFRNNKIQRTFQVKHRWEHWYYRWDGRLLHTSYREPWGRDGTARLVSLAIDPSHDPPLEIRDPMLVTKRELTGPHCYVVDGSESVAYVDPIEQQRSHAPDWFYTIQSWITRYTGQSSKQPDGPQANVRVVNRQSQSTTFVSREPLGYPVYFSPTGRLLVCQSDDDGIAVWDTNPGPRWPWAAAAGLSVLAGCWLLGRMLRRRSATPPPPVPSSPAPS